MSTPISRVNGVGDTCAGVHLSPVSTGISQDDAKNINTSGTTTNSSGRDLAQTSGADSHMDPGPVQAGTGSHADDGPGKSPGWTPVPASVQVAPSDATSKD
jgi:hypothetical protein